MASPTVPEFVFDRLTTAFVHISADGLTPAERSRACADIAADIVSQRSVVWFGPRHDTEETEEIWRKHGVSNQDIFGPYQSTAAIQRIIDLMRRMSNVYQTFRKVFPHPICTPRLNVVLDGLKLHDLFQLDELGLFQNHRFYSINIILSGTSDLSGLPPSLRCNVDFLFFHPSVSRADLAKIVVEERKDISEILKERLNANCYLVYDDTAQSNDDTLKIYPKQLSVVRLPQGDDDIPAH